MVSQPRSVQSSRWDGAIFLIIPGTSCLATIALSLRDKRHPRTTTTFRRYHREVNGGKPVPLIGRLLHRSLVTLPRLVSRLFAEVLVKKLGNLAECHRSLGQAIVK
jgi:hypothetical protein